MSQQWGSHRQFHEDQSRGYVRLYGPRAFGAAQAVRPLQATRAKVEQEYPSGRGGYAGFLSPPVAYGAVQAVTPKQATRANVAQEQPWHPLPNLAPPFPVSAVLPLQANAAKVPQEQPWHPPPWTSAPFPVSAVRPLQGVRAQITQELPWHPVPWLSAPFPGQAPPAAPWGVTARTALEWPWHPSPWTAGSFLPNQGPPPQGMVLRITQEWPGYHPLPAAAMGPPVSATLPLQSVRAQITQEWPGYHPIPGLRSPFPGVPPAAAPWGVTARTTQELPWHPAPWTAGSFLPNYGPPQQGMAVSIRQEWPGYHPLPAAAMGPAASAVVPLQSVRAQIRQEWPGYHPPPTTARPFPVSAAIPLRGLSCRTTQEWPGYHPTATTAWGLFAPVAFRPIGYSTVRQEWPGYHPIPAARGPFLPKIVFPPFPLPGVARTALEWPGYHPAPLLQGIYNFNPPILGQHGPVWWIIGSAPAGMPASTSIGIGPNATYQTRLRSLYLTVSGSSAGMATAVVRDGHPGSGAIIFEADLYTAANSRDVLDFNNIDLRATVGHALTVEFITGTPNDVQEISAHGDYIPPGIPYGVDAKDLG